MSYLFLVATIVSVRIRLRVHHGYELSHAKVGHYNQRRLLVVVQDHLFPRSPYYDSQILTPELHELCGLFQLTCHIRGKNPHYQSVADHNTGILLR